MQRCRSVIHIAAGPSASIFSLQESAGQHADALACNCLKDQPPQIDTVKVQTADKLLINACGLLRIAGRNEELDAAALKEREV